MRNRELDYGDVAPEQFFDSIQEFVSTYVSPNLVVDLLNPTTARIVASTGNGQVACAVGGKMRYIVATITAAHPGGAAGTHALYVTASDNVYVTGPPEVDNTVYAFAMEIRPSGTPATPFYRQIGTVDWSGTAITAIRLNLGYQAVSFSTTDFAVVAPATAARNTIQPSANVVPVTLKGSAGQTAALLDLRDSAAAQMGQWTVAGKVQARGDGAGVDFTFLTETNTGMMRPGAGILGFYVGGNQIGRFESTSLKITGTRSIQVQEIVGLQTAIAVGQNGEAAARALIASDGSYQIGPGSGAPDIGIARVDANTVKFFKSTAAKTRLALQRPDGVTRYIEIDNSDNLIVSTS